MVLQVGFGDGVTKLCFVRMARWGELMVRVSDDDVW